LVNRNQGIRQNPELLAKVLELREQGLTLREVGERVGCSAERVRQICRKEREHASKDASLVGSFA